MTQEHLYQEINAFKYAIEEETGIKLEWGEIALLKQYYLAFNYNMFQTLWAFYDEVFDLDVLELSHHYVIKFNGGKWSGIEHGSDWFRDKRFKQYCNERISMWREDCSIPTPK